MSNTTTIYPKRCNREAWDTINEVLAKQKIPFNTFINALLPALADTLLSHNFETHGCNVDFNLGTTSLK